jgi:GNAT superfamily N-acetyltransferase
VTTELRRLGDRAHDREIVFDLLRAAPTYEARTLGRPTTPEDAVRLLVERPPRSAQDAKCVYLVVADGVPVGLLDLIRGWPRPDVAHIGLLLIREDRHREELGRATVQAVDDLLDGWPEIGWSRLTVVESNLEVLGFWEDAGFVDTGGRRSSAVGDRVHEARVLAKRCGGMRSPRTVEP